MRWNGQRQEGDRIIITEVETEMIGTPGLFSGKRGDLHVTNWALSGAGSTDHPGYTDVDKGVIFAKSEMYPTTPAHEFGHFLGLGHHMGYPNIMGGATPDRHVTFTDMKRVAALYR